MRNVIPYLLKNLFLRQPTYTVMFVTNRCNLKCRMCFYTKQPKCMELTLDEIKRLAKSMPPQWFLMLTGGEPFLRNDIAEIASTFYDQGTMNIHFSTNGTLTEKVIKDIKAIATYARDSHIIVTTSLDGPKDIHDSIRRVAGAYDKTLATTRALVDLKKDYQNLGVAVNFTLSAFNQHCWKETIDFVKTNLQVDAVNIGMTRGSTSDPSAKNFDIKNYWMAQRYIIRTGSRQYFPPMLRFMAKFKDIVQFENIYRIASGDIPPNYHCMAGRIFNVITENGDVYPCEMLNRKMGNLREYDMNFRKLWENPAAKDIRRYIDTRKCLCTYECAMTASLASNWSTTGQFLRFLTQYRRKIKEYYDV